MPRVSVIVPHYNQKGLLVKCLHSLQAQQQAPHSGPATSTPRDQESREAGRTGEDEHPQNARILQPVLRDRNRVGVAAVIAIPTEQSAQRTVGAFQASDRNHHRDDQQRQQVENHQRAQHTPRPFGAGLRALHAVRSQPDRAVPRRRPRRVRSTPCRSATGSDRLRTPSPRRR